MLACQTENQFLIATNLRAAGQANCELAEKGKLTLTYNSNNCNNNEKNNRHFESETGLTVSRPEQQLHYLTRKWRCNMSEEETASNNSKSLNLRYLSAEQRTDQLVYRPRRGTFDY